MAARRCPILIVGIKNNQERRSRSMMLLVGLSTVFRPWTHHYHVVVDCGSISITISPSCLLKSKQSFGKAVATRAAKAVSKQGLPRLFQGTQQRHCPDQAAKARKGRAEASRRAKRNPQSHPRAKAKRKNARAPSRAAAGSERVILQRRAVASTLA